MNTNTEVNFYPDNDAEFMQEAEKLIQQVKGSKSKNLLELTKLLGLHPETDLAGGDLREVNLSGVDLSGFDFSNANLSHANLSHANLSHANLSHANLSHANLSHVNLLHANLSNANLARTTVEKTRFGWNLGLSREMQIDLASKGARWEDGIQEVLSVWEEFVDSDRDWMVAHGYNKFLPSGEILIRQGEPIDTIYIVLNGELDVLVRTTDGTADQRIASISATEMVGEMSFVKERPPSATLKAKKNTLVWSIPRDKLIEKLAQDSEFGYRFHRAISAVLAHRLMETTIKLLDKGSALEDSFSRPAMRSDQEDIYIKSLAKQNFLPKALPVTLV